MAMYATFFGYLKSQEVVEQKMGCRTNRLSDQWAVGPMGCRTNRLSDQWAVEPMGCRTNGLSEYWDVTVFGMTRRGRKPTTYRVRDGHANHLANPTRSGTV